jgi:hypothetical protein
MKEVEKKIAVYKAADECIKRQPSSNAKRLLFVHVTRII